MNKSVVRETIYLDKFNQKIFLENSQNWRGVAALEKLNYFKSAALNLKVEAENKPRTTHKQWNSCLV